MEKTRRQLEKEYNLLLNALVNCHATLQVVNTVFIPTKIKQHIEASLRETTHALKVAGIPLSEEKE